MKKLEAAHHKFQRTLPGTYEKIETQMKTSETGTHN